MGADLNVFDFDYDLTWAVFFLNADEKVYGRYGGRDARHADSWLSLAGLKYAMQAALTAHRQNGGAKPAARSDPPLRVEDFPATKQRRGECIHCHQVYEYRRSALKEAGKWNRDDLWIYPLPENVGLTLEVDVGNRVRAVAPNSPAARVGLRAGDLVQSISGVAVASFADAQYGLHRAPAKGETPITWT